MAIKITIEADGQPTPVVIENVLQFALCGQVAVALPATNGDGPDKVVPVAFNQWAIQNYPGAHNTMIGLLTETIEGLRSQRDEAAKKGGNIIKPDIPIPPPSDLSGFRFRGRG